MATFTFVRGFLPGIRHYGVDLAAPRGTPIAAVAGGSVVYAANEGGDRRAPGYAQGGGNVVHVAVGGGIIHQYAHLDSIRVRSGQAIATGASVGTVGSSGVGLPGQPVTGAHLHFAIWTTAGQPIDPLSVYTVGSLIAAVERRGGAQLVGATGAAAPGLAVPYGDYFRRVRNPPVAPTFVVSTELNRDWAQWVVESYPQVRDYFPVASELFGAGRYTIEQFNADVKARCMAAGAAWIGKPVSSTPAALTIDLPAQSSAFGDLFAGLGALAARAGAFIVLAAFLLIGAYLVATSE